MTPEEIITHVTRNAESKQIQNGPWRAAILINTRTFTQYGKTEIEARGKLASVVSKTKYAANHQQPST